MKFTQTVALIGGLAAMLMAPTRPLHAQGSNAADASGTSESPTEPSTPGTPQPPGSGPSSPSQQKPGAATPPPQPSSQGSNSDLEKAVAKAILSQEQGNTNEAVQTYREIIDRFDRQRTAVAQAIFRLAETYRTQGKTAEAKTLYARLLREFPDQVQLARMAHQRLFPEAKTGSTTPETSSSVTLDTSPPITLDSNIIEYFEALENRPVGTMSSGAIGTDLLQLFEAYQNRRDSSITPDSALFSGPLGEAIEQGNRKVLLVKTESAFGKILGGIQKYADNHEGKLPADLQVLENEIGKDQLREITDPINEKARIFYIRSPETLTQLHVSELVKKTPLLLAQVDPSTEVTIVGYADGSVERLEKDPSEVLADFLKQYETESSPKRAMILYDEIPKRQVSLLGEAFHDAGWYQRVARSKSRYAAIRVYLNEAPHDSPIQWVYQSTAQIAVGEGPGRAEEESRRLQAQDFQELIRSQANKDKVSIPDSVWHEAQIRVKRTRGTSIIEISAYHSNAERAAQLANAVASAFLAARNGTVNLKLITKADVPINPVTSNRIPESNKTSTNKPSSSSGEQRPNREPPYTSDDPIPENPQAALKQIVTGLRAYSEEHKAKLPEKLSEVGPYVGGTNRLEMLLNTTRRPTSKQPGTGTIIYLRPSKRLADIKNKAKIAVLVASNHKHRVAYIAYIRGHVTTLNTREGRISRKLDNVFKEIARLHAKPAVRVFTDVEYGGEEPRFRQLSEAGISVISVDPEEQPPPSQANFRFLFQDESTKTDANERN